MIVLNTKLIKRMHEFNRMVEDQLDLLNPAKSLGYDVSTEEFAREYRAAVEGNRALKQAIVEQNPDLAARIFYALKDRELGEDFFALHKSDPARSKAAKRIKKGLDSIDQYGRLFDQPSQE